MAVVATGPSPAEEAQGLVAEELGRTPFVVFSLPAERRLDFQRYGPGLVDIYTSR